MKASIPSGAMITQTSGHGDFRSYVDRHPITNVYDANLQRLGYYTIADGVPACLAATREELRKGASQIKVMGGRGLASECDPLDSTQYSLDELKAVVTAAKGWNSFKIIMKDGVVYKNTL